jgi:tetratricopeptide (TPR) repeat protein
VSKTKRNRGRRSVRAPDQKLEGRPIIATKASAWPSKAVVILEQRWFLPAVLLVGALLRFSHLFTIRSAPWLQHMQLDHRIYDEWGQRIAAGDWMGSEAYFVDPLYAYFLGTIYWLAGHRPIVVLVIQALFGVGTCYLTCLLGRRVFGPRVGNIACLLMALYAPAIYYEALIEKTALSLFLFTLSLVLYLGNTRRQIILAAVSLGLAALTRGNFLLFIPLGTLALLWRAPFGELDTSAIDEGRVPPPLLSRIRMNGDIAGRFLMASFLVVCVVVVRNSLVAGVTATTTNMGQNLYIGNHAGNVDGTYSPPAFVRPDPRFEEADFRAEAERRLGRGLTPQEISSYWRGQALSDMADHPGLTLERTIKKVRLFWHNYEVPDNGNMYLAREDSLILRLPLLSMGILFPLALLGAGLSFRSNHQARSLTMIAVVYCGSIVAFFILARFRLQILPVLAVLASFGATRLVAVARSRSWRGLALYGGAVVAGAMFSLITPSWLEATKAPSLAIGYNNLGALYSEEGRVDLAITAYEKAIGIEPKSVVGAMRSVGELYLGRGEYDKAEIHMRRVLDLKPDSRIGREALVRLYGTMSRDPAYHGDREELRQKLANAYQRVGRVQDAEPLVRPVADRAKAEASSVTNSSGRFDEVTANAVVRGLSGVGPGHPVWFSTSDRTDDGDEFYRVLRELFVRAGWVVRRVDRVPFPLKAGLFLFAADDRPPEYVTAIQSALMNAGMNIALHTGYRGYYQEMKRTNPAWNGFAMSPDQTFTIVVGRRPNTVPKH